MRPQPPTRPSAPEPFNGVRVFSATKHSTRNELGELVTAWLARHPLYRIYDFEVRQSSDDGFHCLTIVVLYRDLSGDSGAQT